MIVKRLKQQKRLPHNQKQIKYKHKKKQIKADNLYTTNSKTKASHQKQQARRQLKITLTTK